MCLQRSADLHMAQLMPLPLTVSCFSKIQPGFTFPVLAHSGSPRQRAVKRVCVYFVVVGSMQYIKLTYASFKHTIKQHLISYRRNLTQLSADHSNNFV